MNKISKKIVALVTMAAFVLTLAPVAAFADGASPQASTFTVTVDGDAVAANEADKVSVKINVKDASGYPTDSTLSNIYVWASEGGNAVSDAFEVVSGTEASTGAGTLDNVYYLASVQNSSDALQVKFSRAGEYTIHVAQGSAPTLDSVDDVTTVIKSADPVVTVDAASQEIATITADSTKIYGDSATSYTDSDKIIANNTATGDVVVKVTDDQGRGIEGLEFKVKSSSSLIYPVADTYTTDENGEFTVTYKAKADAQARLTLTNGSVSTYFTVATAGYGITPGAETPVGIQTITTGEDIVDTDLVAADGSLEGVVEFAFTNAAGETITDVELNAESAKEPAAQDGDTATDKKADYVSIIAQPDDSDLTVEDVKIVEGEDGTAYLKLADKESYVPGKYEVSIALLSGESAKATFNVVQFDEENIEGIRIDVPNDSIYYEKAETVTDKTAKFDVYLVDKDGVERLYKGDSDPSELKVAVGSTESDLVKKVIIGTGGKINVTYSNDEELLGNKFTLFAFAGALNASTDVTFTEKPADPTVAGLAFDATYGPLNNVNKVKVSVVDKDGNPVSSVNATVYATLESSSNENAAPEVEVTNADITSGKNGEISIYAYEETKLEINVKVVDKASGVLYADTLTYTVGAEDVPEPEKTTIAMTIGSADYVVNNEVLEGDAAPYIKDGRTMVPFRALGEALGAEVVWDNDARTVTYTLGDNEVVMTIGETTYTVNGEEATMDVAPEIVDSRTFVPSRFVTEALGATITPLANADGTTAAIVIQK